MERYSVIVVADETAPVRRFDVRRAVIRRAVWGAGIAAVVLAVSLVDYVRVRIDHAELVPMRARVAEQKAKIEGFETELRSVSQRLDRIRELERKVRIIANLPGSAATGGVEIAEVGSEDPEAPAIDASALEATSDASARAPAGSSGSSASDDESAQAAPAAAPDPGVDISALREDAHDIGLRADLREQSLEALTGALEGKRDRLASTPSIWPTRGWLTSRFGMRVSPFTNRKQFHAGLDIAGERGTDVIAPAKGRVVFSGTRGPLGKSLIIDHGHGVRTLYGHSDELLVKRGDTVERGTRIAALGNTGRSTGPHLHYVVEVDGKAVNPLDYIFD